MRAGVVKLPFSRMLQALVLDMLLMIDAMLVEWALSERRKTRSIALRDV
jgi:hypothetical protein